MAFDRIKSNVLRNSDEFQANRNGMLNLVNTLKDRLRLATEEGKKQHIDRHMKRGQLLGMLNLLFSYLSFFFLFFFFFLDFFLFSIFFFSFYFFSF